MTPAGDPVRRAGFDYGCLPYAMAVSTFAFASHLHDAGVIGAAYGYEKSELLRATVPALTLVGSNEAPLRKAFAEFRAWTESSDGDALEVSIIFRTGDGYLLALSPEPDRLERRCLGFDRTHQVITSAITWCKPIDTVSPGLLQLRDYSRAFPAPLLFGCAVLPYAIPGAPVDPSSLQFLDGESILKFDMTFVEEAAVLEGTTAWVALQTTQKNRSNKTPAAPPFIPERVWQRRTAALRTHFPVTIERFRKSETLQALAKEVAQKGARDWQIEQALCNLVLSQELCGKPHFAGVSADSLEATVIRSLQDRYEKANGAVIAAPSLEEMIAQIVADTEVVLRSSGRPRRIVDLESASAAVSEIEGLPEARKQGDETRGS